MWASIKTIKKRVANQLKILGVAVNFDSLPSPTVGQESGVMQLMSKASQEVIACDSWASVVMDNNSNSSVC